MKTSARPKRHLVRYRLRRLQSVGWFKESTADCHDELTHFVYDFDNDVLAADHPRERYASALTILRRPKIILGIPRPGRLKWWSRITTRMARRLHFEQDHFADSFLLERLTTRRWDDGWDARATFHVRDGATAYVREANAEHKVEVFATFGAALSQALADEKHTVREFLWNLNAGIVTHILSIVLAAGVAFAFPLAVAFASSIIPTAPDRSISLPALIVSTTVVLAAAYFFFGLRSRSQRFYGAIELGVGIGMAIASLRNVLTGDRLDLVLKIMASVYVMIRGMVNIHEGLMEHTAKRNAFLSGVALDRHAEILQQLQGAGVSRSGGG